MTDTNLTEPNLTEPHWIEIDGCQGEGGGQMVRSSLALSMVTGKPVRIVNIRAGRDKPGLMRQHLTCVQAAAEVSRAKVTGDKLGSTAISFEPQAVVAGEYHFRIGTAGSASLVVQTLLPALMIADSPSVIVVEGGTPVGGHLADQWMLPLAISAWQSRNQGLRGGGVFRTQPLSLHSLTHLQIIERFLEIKATVEELDGGVHAVRIE